MQQQLFMVLNYFKEAETIFWSLPLRFANHHFSPVMHFPPSLFLSLSQWLPPFKISSGHIFHTLKLLPIKILNVCVYVLWRTRVREKRNEENVRLRMKKNSKR